jgi:hypothetical protein
MFLFNKFLKSYPFKSEKLLEALNIFIDENGKLKNYLEAIYSASDEEKKKVNFIRFISNK